MRPGDQGRRRQLPVTLADAPLRVMTRAAGEGAITFLIALVVAMVVFPAIHPGPRVAIVVIPVILGAALLLRDPKWCVVALIAAVFFGTNRTSIPVGFLDLRPSDVPHACLVAWAVHLRLTQGRRLTARVGQLQIGVLLLVFGVSLSAAFVAGGPEFVRSLVSWLRVVLTLSLIWVVPQAVRTRAGRDFVLRAIALVGAAELLRASVAHLLAGSPARLRGANGPNAEGLIAVIVILIVLSLPLFSPRVRLALGAIGVTALVLTASISSVATLVLVLAIFGLRLSTVQSPRAAALVLPARTLLLVAGGILLVSTLRPNSLPSSDAFDQSSTTVRIVLGYAGLEIFRDNILFGVGWQRSSRPDVIGPVLQADEFRGVFADVDRRSIPSGSASVHNAYVQVLAESGLVGFCTLIAGLVAGRRGIRRLIGSAGPDEAVARTLAALLIAILIWWNDNPIFGALPETISFAVLLGLMAGFGAGANQASTRAPATSV